MNDHGPFLSLPFQTTHNSGKSFTFISDGNGSETLTETVGSSSKNMKCQQVQKVHIEIRLFHNESDFKKSTPEFSQ